MQSINIQLRFSLMFVISAQNFMKMFTGTYLALWLEQDTFIVEAPSMLYCMVVMRGTFDQFKPCQYLTKLCQGYLANIKPDVFRSLVDVFWLLGPPLQCLWGFNWQIVSTMRQAKRGFCGYLPYTQSFCFNLHIFDYNN